MGVVSYLTKPVDEHLLLDTLREALEHGSHVAD
jgi:FixJ family two-component response regulator